MSNPTNAAQSAVLDSVDTATKTVQQLFDLTGRFAVVTGGARGLGLTIAGGFLEAGAHVALIDVLSEADEVEFAPVRKLADSKEVSLTYHKSNITDEASVSKTFDMIKAVAQGVGATISIVLNAAGIQHRKSAFEHSAADFRRVLDVNVLGSMLVAQQAALAMREAGKGGSIILVASMSGTITNRGMNTPAYNASKSAVLQLARSLAVEFGASDGIRVNTLSPGYAMTEMTANLLRAEPELSKQWKSDNPLARLSQPWEYKGPSLFLASDASSFMTGSDLRVDGGHCAW